jgi:5-methylcytosine-specific restriction endonuclease McrA
MKRNTKWIKTKGTPYGDLQQKLRDPKVVGLKCEKCGEIEHLTVDHIVPISFLQQFAITPDPGFWLKENMTYLCFHCNRKKGAEIDPRDPRTYEVIRKLLLMSEKFHKGHIK